jgi:hypothetical protein
MADPEQAALRAPELNELPGLKAGKHHLGAICFGKNNGVESIRFKLDMFSITLR